MPETPPVITKLEIDGNNLQVDTVAEITLTATATYSDGTTKTVTGSNGEWATSAAAIAKRKGTASTTKNVFVGVSAGVANITVTFEGLTNTKPLTVVDHPFDYQVLLKWGYIQRASDVNPFLGEGKDLYVDLDVQAYDVQDNTTVKSVGGNPVNYTSPSGAKIWLDDDVNYSHYLPEHVTNEHEIITMQHCSGRKISIGVIDFYGNWSKIIKHSLPAKAVIEIRNSENVLIKSFNFPDNAYDDVAKGEYYVCDINIPASGPLTASHIVHKGIKGQLK